MRRCKTFNLNQMYGKAQEVSNLLPQLSLARFSLSPSLRPSSLPNSLPSSLSRQRIL